MLLSVLIGIGIALFIEILLSLLFYQFVGKFVFGLILVFHPLFALCNGVIASRLFLLFHGTDWIFLAIYSAVSMPTIFLVIF